MTKDIRRLKNLVMDSLRNSPDKVDEIFRKDFEESDHLGRAARSGQAARESIKLGDFDKAWGFYHDQKVHYMRHCQRCELTNAQIVALDASVSADLANILRLEGRHREALPHTMYWVATLGRPLAKHSHDKLRAYLNRCKLKGTSLEDLISITLALGATPDFREAQIKAQEIIAKG